MEGKVAAYGYESYYMVAAVSPVAKIDARSAKNQNSGSFVPNRNSSAFGNILKEAMENNHVEENRLEGKPVTYGSLGQIFSGIKLQKVYNEIA